MNARQPGTEGATGSGTFGVDGDFLLVYSGTVHSKYVAVLPDEVSLEVGQDAEIYQLYEDGWCYGKAGDRMGFMPMNFIKLM